MKSLPSTFRTRVDPRLRRQAAAEFPSLNVLINNAGIMRRGESPRAAARSRRRRGHRRHQPARPHPPDRGAFASSREAAARHDLNVSLRPGVSASGAHAHLLRHQGRHPLLHAFAAPPAPLDEHRGAGTDSALRATDLMSGAEDPARHAAQAIHRRGDGDPQAAAHAAGNLRGEREGFALRRRNRATSTDLQRPQRGHGGRALQPWPHRRTRAQVSQPESVLHVFCAIFQ